MTSHPSEDLISQWLDRELDALQSGQVEEHLRNCESCRAVENELSAVDRIYRNAEVLEPPPYLWTRIAAHLEEERREERQGFLALRHPWLRARVWAPVTMLLLALVGAIAFVEYRASERAQLAAIAEIDRAHNTVLALSIKNYNPFHETTGVDAGANPFARANLRVQNNPFRLPPDRP